MSRILWWSCKSILKDHKLWNSVFFFRLSWWLSVENILYYWSISRGHTFRDELLCSTSLVGAQRLIQLSLQSCIWWPSSFVCLCSNPYSATAPVVFTVQMNPHVLESYGLPPSSDGVILVLGYFPASQWTSSIWNWTLRLLSASAHWKWLTKHLFWTRGYSL
jgi:hypothetical protein